MKTKVLIYFEYYKCYAKTVECYWLSLPVLSLGNITTDNLQCIYIIAKHNFTQSLKELVPLVITAALQETDTLSMKILHCVDAVANVHMSHTLGDYLIVTVKVLFNSVSC